MELTPNMYVRTLNGIVKIDKIQNDVMKDTKGCLHYGDFIKASHNIIDLIEVGDYVNGKEITSKDENRKRLYAEMIQDYVYFDERDIKSIVTKEQFEAMEYKID